MLQRPRLPLPLVLPLTLPLLACDAASDEDLAFRSGAATAEFEEDLDPTTSPTTAGDPAGGTDPTGDPTDPATGGPGTVDEPGPGGLPPSTGPGGIDGPAPSGFVCPYRITASNGPEERALPYCASQDIDEPPTRDDIRLSRVKRLVISQHGRGSNAEMYYNRMVDNAALVEGELEGATFVVAPQFIQDEYAGGIPQWQLDELQTFISSDWAQGGASDGGGIPRYSFEMIERLVQKHVDVMPNLEKIIFIGQSAGGQAVQKFALLSMHDFGPTIDVEYFVANPKSFAYLNEERPMFDAEENLLGFQVPGGGAWPWSDSGFCDPLDGTPLDGHYNRYSYGLTHLPGFVMDGLPNTNVQDAIEGQKRHDAYLDKNVTYLASELDVLTELKNDMDCNKKIYAQGRSRRERSLGFYEHVQSLGANHHRVEVPDAGHGGVLFKRKCIAEVIFGLGDDCDPLMDHTGADFILSASKMDTADVDGDGRLEVAVMSGPADDPLVLLLDDIEHDYALIDVMNEDWPEDEIPTDIAFGDVVGFSDVELVVSRRSDSFVDGGGVVVYGVLGGDEWEPLVSWDTWHDVVGLDIGKISADTFQHIAVAYDVTAGDRWSVGHFVGGNWVELESGSWLGNAPATDIKLGNLYGDDPWDEIVVGRDATDSVRLYTTDPGGSKNGIGSFWNAGAQMTDFAVGDFDDDGLDEIVVATASNTVRYRVHNDGDAGFGTMLTGGEHWDPGVQPTKIAIGKPADFYGSIAVARTGPVDTKVEQATFFHSLGSIEHYRHDAVLEQGAFVGSLHFADVDGLGGDELMIGRDGVFNQGWRIKTLARP